MTNFFSFHKKIRPQVQIVYKTLTKVHLWYIELGKILAIVVVVSAVVWGASKADADKSKPKSWVASALISGITDSTFSINNAETSDKSDTDSYTFNISTVNKIVNGEGQPLQFSDIKVGDQVVVQGVSIDGTITAYRIFSFSSTTSSAIVATTTIITTTSDTPTSTPIVATSTDDAPSSTATTSLINNVSDAVKDVVQGIVDIVTGSTTSDATATEVVATSTDEVVVPTTTPAASEVVQDASSSTE